MYKSTKILSRCLCVVCVICIISLLSFSSFAKVSVTVSQFQMGNTFQVTSHFKALGVEVSKAFSMGNGIYNWVVDKYPAYNGKVGTYSPIFNADRDNNGQAATNIFQIGLISKFQPPASRPDIPQDQSNYYCTITVLSELDDTQGFTWTQYCNSPTNAALYVLDQNGNQTGNSIAMELIGQKVTGSTIASVYSFSMGSFDMLTSFLTYGMCVTYFYSFDIPYTGSVKHLNWNVMRPILNVSYDAETAEAIGSATYDLISNDITPTLKNTESLASEILSSQQEMKNSIDQVPDKVADALESREVEAAESADAVFKDTQKEIAESNPIPFNSLANSLKSFVTSAGSLERCHSLKFPAITIPKMGNNEAITVSEEQSIDFDSVTSDLPPVLVVGSRLVASALLYWGLISYLKHVLEGVFET